VVVSRAIDLLDGPGTNEVNMLEPIQISDDRTTIYATVADFCEIFTEEMHSLYLLAFLLTADNDKAEQCFVNGLGECEEGIGVFMEWARSWARRAILKHAIRMIVPARQHADSLSFISLKRAATAGKNNLFAAIVALNAFERFVFVMSVLERQSDEDCSSLLGCSRRDIIMARTLAIQCLANTDTGRDQSGEALQAWRTIFADHHA
jgi:hypothetical protein